MSKEIQNKKEFKVATIKISIGDIVKFQKGMLMQSALTGNTYLVKKAKYRGDDRWLSIEKEEVKNND